MENGATTVRRQRLGSAAFGLAVSNRSVRWAARVVVVRRPCQPLGGGGRCPRPGMPKQASRQIGEGGNLTACSLQCVTGNMRVWCDVLPKQNLFETDGDGSSPTQPIPQPPLHCRLWLSTPGNTPTTPNGRALITFAHR